MTELVTWWNAMPRRVHLDLLQVGLNVLLVVVLGRMWVLQWKSLRGKR